MTRGRSHGENQKRDICLPHAPREPVIKTDDQEQRFLEALRAVLEEFGNYGEPRVRGDGDIQIPLDIELKKARARQSNLADAFSRMMSEDLGPKRSSTWVK